VATAAFWRTFHHDGKINPAGEEGEGVNAHPFSLYLLTHIQTTKLQCMLQLRVQIHSPYFMSTLYALGGFNVSNLMGIKRRMIDIGKKITFYFLQNV
jgi:hypothetical protein